MIALLQWTLRAPGIDQQCNLIGLRFERPPPADMQDLIAALKALPS